MKFFIQENKKIFIYFFLFLIVYVKYIFFVGLSPGDDYFHLNFVENNPSFIENIKLNYLISPARPISSLMLGIIHPLVGNNIIIYNFISLFLWISCAFILKETFKLLINKEFSEIFFIIFSFPYLCFSVFYGNLLWSNYILFIFFWSISIFFQVKYYNYNNNNYKLLYYFFLIISIFTFELIISLLIINILLPINFKIKKKNIILNFFLILTFSLVYFFYKFYLIPYLIGSSIYGVAEFGLKNFLQGVYFFYSVAVENFILLIQSINFSLNYVSFIILILVIYLFFDFKIKESINNRFILIIFVLSLISCSIIYFISGYPAITYGHYSKTLVPAFFSFSTIISYLFVRFKINKWLLGIVIFLVINSTYIQINNYAEATKIKNNLVDGLVNNINKIDIMQNDIIVVNAPLFVNNNYNNEEIVFTTWDLKFRILNITKKNFNFWLINNRLIENTNYYPLHNFLNSKYLKSDSFDQHRIIYYEYNNGLYNFEIFLNKSELEKKISDLRVNKINKNKYIFREKIRLKIKKIILNII